VIAFVLALISVLAFGVATDNVSINSLEHWNGVAQTPAQQAGLAAGDTILSVDGTSVSSPAALAKVIEEHRPGTSVSITYDGENGTATTHATLVAGPAL